MLVVMDLGHINAPSLAIINPELSNLSSFGEITLIAKSKYLPELNNKSIKAFASDAYTPRNPSLHMIFDENDVRNIFNRFHQDYKNNNNIVNDKIEFTNEKLINKIINLNNNCFSFLDEGFLHAAEMILLKHGIEPQYELNENKKKNNIFNVMESETGKSVDEVININNDMDKLDDLIMEFVQKRKKSLNNAILEAQKNNNIVKEESYKKELSFLKYDNVMALYQKSINDINDVNNEINIYKTTINIMNQLKENGLEKEYNDFRFDMRTELINSKSIEYKLFDDIDKKEIPYTNENALKLINKYIKSGGVRLNEKLYNRSSIHSLNELKAMVSEEIKSKNDISLNINKLESYANVNNSEDNFFNEYLPKFKKVLPELDDNKLDTIMLNAILRLNKSKKDFINEMNILNIHDESKIEEIAKVTRDALKAVKNLPSPYFELKVLESLWLSDFSHAVIPSDLDLFDKIKERLENSGLKVTVYDTNTSTLKDALTNLDDTVKIDIPIIEPRKRLNNYK